ncbi:hypothetical protein DFH08DRAFT_860816 [Mycena albidolilacea]|uniref:Uncharacterized protein n=1 Tax=Mycena albidolilacea TaxID=1033008 RepID=A0AAD7ETW1_9AGAR|nr:hypothetical protein DFH08DRAFT_860816 [Mycena albidolilacea]
MHASTSVLKARRRKPTHTYQSPSAADRAPTIAKTLSALSHQLASASTSASNSTSKSTPAQGTSTGIVVRTDTTPRKKYPMAPPLPLYHPFGRLALSLPPLEPSYFGHSTPISIDDSDSGRRSARSRRPAAKLRDAEEDEPPSRPVMSNVSAIAAVAAREIKEKASPRKRRGGGGAGAKRKRKDVDDGDATYPAKRTRNPRGGSTLLPEDASPSDSMVPLPDVTPTPEPAAEQDDRQPERRTTRSAHGALKRRDSSASSSTASASVGTRGASKVNGTLPAPHVDPPSDAEMRTSGDTKEAKEEGEVSEEAP